MMTPERSEKLTRFDVCCGHGSWFDRDELRRIVQFIRAGGLDAARARDLRHWETQKRRHRPAPVASIDNAPPTGRDLPDCWDLPDLLGLIGRVLVQFLFRQRAPTPRGDSALAAPRARR